MDKNITMKNNKIKTGLLVLGMVLFFMNSGIGQSQNRQERRTPPTFKQLIKEMDANEDGKLSKDEIKGRLKDDFEKVDTDEDGFITAKEFAKAPKPERRSRQ